MNYLYELFLASSAVSTEELNNLNFKIVKNLGAFQNYSLVVTFSDGIIRFFIDAPKDISHISEGLSLGVLKAIEKIPDTYSDKQISKKNHFLHLQAVKNLYELKENVQTKKELDLKEAKFNIKILPMMSLITKANFFYESSGMVSKSSLISNNFPASFLAIDFSQNKKYFKKSFPSYLNIEKALHGLVQNENGAVLAVDGFPYFSDKRYLNLNNYQFDKHSFIIGSSGSGKSKFIELLISKMAGLQFKDNYKIIVIDPHASLAEGLANIPGFKDIDFKSSSTDLFPDANSDISAATELTATLFKSLLADSYNPKAETVLKFSLLVLLTAQAMSLPNLKMFITDLDFRNQVLEHVGSYVPVNVKKFFGADFNELRTKHYNDAIVPIASLVDEMQMQPAISNQDQYSLAKHIQENFLTVFSLNKVSMGEKVVKTVAGLLIQQIFLLAQTRTINQKIILFIDEVSVVQNPALAAILSEARKFNLFVVLTQQYFGQIEKDLQDSILTNVSNYYIFRISEEDARKLEGNLKISIPANVLEAAKQKGQKETDLRVKMLTELNPRECIFRVELGGQYLPCVKGRTLNIKPPETSQDIKLNFVEMPQKLPDKFIFNDSGDQVAEIKNHPENIQERKPPQQPIPMQKVKLNKPSQAPTQSPFGQNKMDSQPATCQRSDNHSLMDKSALGRAMLTSFRSSYDRHGSEGGIYMAHNLKQVLESQSPKKVKGDKKR